MKIAMIRELVLTRVLSVVECRDHFSKMAPLSSFPCRRIPMPLLSRSILMEIS